MANRQPTNHGNAESDEEELLQNPERVVMPLLTKVQRHCNVLDKNYGIKLPLPRVIVAGGQTAGKSSTLENMASQQLLPTGTDMVTKSLISLEFQTSDQRNYTIDNQTYTDSTLVAKAIEKASNQLAAQGGGVSEIPVEVIIRFPDVPNLTLIDVPGYIETNRYGQDEQLPKKVRQLLKTVLQNDKAIILVVACALDEFQRDQVINIVRKYDGDGNRTFVVFTKLDLVQSAEQKEQLHKNLELARQKFRLGATTVVNRSGNESFKVARAKEKRCIEQLFTATEAPKHGIEYLTHQLSMIHMKQTKDSLPEVFTALHRHINLQDAVLKRVGVGDVSNKRETLRDCLRRFRIEYKAQLEGSNLHGNYHNVCAGTFIRSTLEMEFFKELEDLEKEISCSDKQMVFAIAHSMGAVGMDYMAEQAFVRLVHPEIMKMQPACFNFLGKVYYAVTKEVPKGCYPFVEDGESSGVYPALQDEILRKMEDVLKHQYKRLKEQLSDIVAIQASIPETFDEKFQEIKDKEPPENKIISAKEFFTMKEKYLNGAAEQNDGGGDKRLDYIRRLIKEYVKIVKIQVQDYVRKQIKSQLIFFASDKESLGHSAIELNREGELISEPAHITEQRETAQKAKKELMEALRGFEEIKSIVTQADGFVSL